MNETPKYTQRKLPVLIGLDRGHIMGKANIYRSESETLIQITLIGSESKLLAEFLEQVEPIALSFDAIPVRNIREKRETN